MNTPELLAYLQSLDVKIWVEGEHLRCSAPKAVLTADLRAEIAARKPEIIAILSEAAPAAPAPSLGKFPRPQHIPLAYPQRQIWFQASQVPDSPAYQTISAQRIRSPLDLEALERSLGEVLRRHEILRTRFPLVDGSPLQQVMEPGPFHLPQIDLRAVDPAGREVEARRRLEDEANRPLDLATGPPIRFCLYRLDTSDCILLTVVHHLVLDCVSLNLLGHEIARILAACSAGLPSPLPEPAFQYADFTLWQLQFFQSPAFQQQMAYWQGQLADRPSRLTLPADRPFQTAASRRAESQVMVLSADLSAAVFELARRARTTLFMILLATFNLLLQQLSGQDDLLLGFPTAGRTQPGLENAIGRYLNTLVLRTNLAGAADFGEVLRRVSATVLDAFSNQEVPFGKLVESICPDCKPGENPFFDIQMNFAPLTESTGSSGGEVSDYDLRPAEVEAHYPLTLYIGLVQERIRLELMLQEGIFTPRRARQFLEDYQKLLEQIVAGSAENGTALQGFKLGTDEREAREEAGKRFSAQEEETGDAHLSKDAAAGEEEEKFNEREAGAGQAGFSLRPGEAAGTCAAGVWVDLPARPADQVAPPLQGSGRSRSEIETTLSAIWKETLKVEQIPANADFFALGGHSLQVMKLLVRIREVFGVNLPLHAFFKDASLAALVQRIEDQAGLQTWPSLVVIQPHGTRLPFFCVHGVTGDVVFFEYLRPFIAADQPFYGLQSRGLDGVQEPLESMEAMAAHYIREMRRVQPQGPYHILGYSNGGSIAYEMGCQLQEQGLPVGLLGVIDHASPKSDYYQVKLSPRFFYNVLINLPYRISDFLHLRPDQALARLGRKLHLFRKSLQTTRRNARLTVEARDLIDAAPDLPPHIQRIIETNFAAIQQYMPRHYAGKLTLIRARGGHLLVSHDPYMGWKQFAEQVEVRLIPGSHISVFRPQHIHHLARQIQICMDEAQAAAGLQT